MRIKDLTAALEAWAPRSLQEEYDNCGLQVGDPDAELDSALVCLDCTEAVVEEAVAKGCGLIVSHHPLIFKGLKSLVARSYVERTLLAAIKNGVAVYALHTNLDNLSDGVNGEIAARLALRPMHVLDPKSGQLRKLVVYVPKSHAFAVREALFEAGAGQIGAYDQCSFSLVGEGTFRPREGAKPFLGHVGERHQETEERIEVLYPTHREARILSAMRGAHPYEEVAYDLLALVNTHGGVGSGLLAEFETPMEATVFLNRLKEVFGLKVLRHSRLLGSTIKRVAICGGSGAFLLDKAVSAGADTFITGDLKYHQYFDADSRLLLVDIGHYGSEQFTPHLIQRRLGEVFPTFAVRLTEIVTDPIYHY